MNSKDLYNAIGQVDDDVLEESEAVASRRKTKSIWVKSGTIAACLCLVLAGATVRKHIQVPRPDTEVPGITCSEDGVTIPRMNVSLSAKGAAADMIAFFIYQGRCYVQYDWIYGDTDIIGEYLGTAAGLIDEWTPEDGYVECAGSVYGDFYAVKGYDPAFILCMKHATGTVTAYICSNGITLKYGAELYEDRFHLSANLESVQYESHDSWFYSRGERYQMDSVNDTVLDFIQAMDSARFIPYDAVPPGEGQDGLEELYHLYFQMENGITVHLRLYENGYAMLQGLWDLYVQIPEESCSALLELLDGHAGSTAVTAAGDVGPTFEDCRNDAELGSYVPAYAPEDLRLVYAAIYYDLDRQTARETGTKAIYLSYENPENPRCFYFITVARADELEKNGWVGPMFRAADLSVEAISEYIEPEDVNEGPISAGSLEIGVWCDDISVVISARGITAENVYEILNSIP